MMSERYDLDKTQAWANRTMIIGQTPMTRGGLESPGKQRWQTALFVVSALGLVGLSALLFPSRDSSLHKNGKETATPPISMPAPIQTSIAAAVPYSPQTPVYTRPAPYQNGRNGASGLFIGQPQNTVERGNFNASEVSLSGGIHPLPGHIAPSAPIGLDGLIR